MEIVAGRGSPHGGVYIDVSHLGASFVERNFPSMVERCRDVGFDLALSNRWKSPPQPTLLDGRREDRYRLSQPSRRPICRWGDSAGMHGANRLGGNGVACSTVFGGIAGDHTAAYIEGKRLPEVVEAQLYAVIARIMDPFDRPRGEDIYVLRHELKALMWEKAGLGQNASDLEHGQTALAVIRDRTQLVHVSGAPRLNAEWHEWLNLESLLTVSDMIIASALQRKESRGVHYRSDYPEPDNSQYLQNIYLQRDGEGVHLCLVPVQFTRLEPPDATTPALEQRYLAQEEE